MQSPNYSRLLTALAMAFALVSSACGRAPTRHHHHTVNTSTAAQTIYLTGYGWYDNTPPGSAQIAHPVLHTQAGGTGTWADPITIAVGWSLSGGIETDDYAAGTRIYLPALKKYAIVEDLCGDPPNPQNKACHIGYEGHPWLDIYIGGSTISQRAEVACADRITGLQTAIFKPQSGYPVSAGEISLSTCASTS